jgi:hypothetical protein
MRIDRSNHNKLIMQIEGIVKLQLLKRAFESHLNELSYHAMRSDDKTMAEKWDPEITETNRMLDYIEINLKREEEYKEVIPVLTGE